MALAITIADQRRETDVLILARGGGSLEDLWSFNSELVARAIYLCRLPIITGIGHEIDFTIADFVADVRAPTPSAAAEMAVPNRAALLERLNLRLSKLMATMSYRLETGRQPLRQLEKRLPDPVRQLQYIGQRLDDISMRVRQTIRILIAQQQQSLLHLSSRLNTGNPLQKIRLSREQSRYLCEQLQHGMTGLLLRYQARLEQQAHALQTVSPLATLARGYAIVTHNDTILRNAAAVQPGELVKSRLAQGSLYSKVTKIEND